MKPVAIIFALVAVAVAAPQKPGEAIILKFENENNGVDGQYNYAYETSDGQAKEEVGEVVHPGTDQQVLHVRGHFSYIGTDGQTYEVQYTADETGFHPQGAHIPAAA